MPPYFTNPSYSVTVNGLTVSALQAVYDLDWRDDDSSPLTVTYTAPDTSHIFGNTLWSFDTGTGVISTTKTLNTEFTYTYLLIVTVADSRKSASATVTINLNACHMTPNCTDQSITIPDTFAVGGTLLTQNIPSKSQFTGLSFSMSTALLQASIDPTTERQPKNYNMLKGSKYE
ncbi:hypothetical protein CHS0354_018767 [Potamilus streckersoni]|uniref:Cadherin domain-containing protein n=1 Tax=Potamilus streckersoni TaxID=2493646 RepID=A0AAE0T375_9BIVA|nr:hypothetical protein CHS0354_018767 [Potamilus streckersoni]